MAWKKVERRTDAAKAFIARHPKTYPLIKDRAWEIARRQYHGILARTHLIQALNELLDAQEWRQDR